MATKDRSGETRHSIIELWRNLVREKSACISFVSLSTHFSALYISTWEAYFSSQKQTHFNYVYMDKATRRKSFW